MIKKLFCFVLFFQLYFSESKYMQITSLKECAGKSYPVHIYKMRVRNARSAQISYVAKVTKNLTEDFKFKLIMTRCKSEETLDTCEDFGQTVVPHICKQIKLGVFEINSDPPLPCPFKIGNYKVNETINISPVLMSQINGWFYNIRCEMIEYNSENLIGCTETKMTIR